MLNENRESLSIPGFLKDPQLGVRFLALLRINKDISKSKGRGPKVQILKLALHYVVGMTMQNKPPAANKADSSRQGVNVVQK
jgi:hypothetical protein